MFDETLAAGEGESVAPLHRVHLRHSAEEFVR